MKGEDDMIKFEKFMEEAKLRSPAEGFREVVQHIEVRKDPLTGRKCRINVDRAKRPKQTTCDTSDFDKIVEKSKAKCFFCPEHIEKSTPMFAEGLPDRIKEGSACLFPNLFPFGGYHAVGVFSADHFLEANHFTPKLLEDCFKTCLKYFELINQKHSEVRYWHINWNHMYPAAASIIHPHVQIIAEAEPSSNLHDLLDQSKSYHKRVGRNYWSDLVSSEKAVGERFIGETGHVTWLSSFAPQDNREVVAVFSGTSSMVGLENHSLHDFCRGLSKVLKGYYEACVRSFNMGVLAGPCDEDIKDHYLLNARLVSRPTPAPFYTSDKGFMELFHREPVIETMPEDLAKCLRPHF
jgi:galactose-1-phosphate uridylyltransferase